MPLAVEPVIHGFGGPAFGGLLAVWLKEQGIRSKAYLSKSGRRIGGVAFSRGALFHLITNRTYLGEIPHKDQSYPGAHPPIIDPELFAAAQSLMSENTRRHHSRPTRVSTMLLKGLIFDADGAAMCPAFGYGRGGQVYRYYVSSPLQQGGRRPAGDEAIRRVPAGAIEALVLGRLSGLAPKRLRRALDTGKGIEGLRRVEIHPNAVHLELFGQALFGLHADIAVETVNFNKRLEAGERAFVDQDDPQVVRVVLPARLKVRGGRSWMVGPSGMPALDEARTDRTLIAGLRNAHRLAGRLKADGASAKAPERAYDRQLCLLAFLAPDIQRAILEGRQPPGFNLESLIHGSIPLAWVDQRPAFGFPASNN